MSRDNECSVLLCAGPLNESDLPTGTSYAKAMAPINGKPVIGWLLDELIFKGVRRVTVVLRSQNVQLQAFLRRAYAHRIDVTVVALDHDGTIVESLHAGLSVTPGSGVVRIILGDTLIRDSFDGSEDFVYTGTVDDSRRWCVARVGALGEIVELNDKQELSSPPYDALAGYYHFQHAADLRRHVEASCDAGERDLSDVLRRYITSHPLLTRHATQWFDFGHIDNLVSARRRLLQPRYFNALTINPVLNTITKVSEHTSKLADELAWFEQIPQELKVLTPRILTARDAEGNVQVSQEYYGYPTLAELYTYGNFPSDVWRSILRHVLRIHQEFRRYPGTLDPSYVTDMYSRKTWERLGLLAQQSEEWRALLAADSVLFEGRRLRGLSVLRASLDAMAAELAGSASIAIVHGDFCFSNILFDINHQIVRLIDPRGSFGKSGIYGDVRYDIAKLRHSVSGLYDFVMADLFDLTEDADGYHVRYYSNERQRTVPAEFDRMIESLGYDLREIRFIEGLLFVSMVPYHKGHPNRQRLLYLTGVNLLNEVL